MKLDNVVAALAARNRKVEVPDLTPIMDEIVSGVLTRQTDQAERERRLQKSLVTAFKNVEAKINAIPQVDLSPVIDAIVELNKAVMGIEFPDPPEVKFPDPPDMSSLQRSIDDLNVKFDAFHVDMPEVTVNTPSVPSVIVEERPKVWNFKIIRNANGGIREVEATAE